MTPDDIAVRHVKEGVELFIAYCRDMISDDLADSLRKGPSHVSRHGHAPGNFKPLERTLLAAVLAHVSQAVWNHRSDHHDLHDMVHDVRSRWLDDHMKELKLKGTCVWKLIEDWERIAGYVLHREPLTDECS